MNPQEIQDLLKDATSDLSFTGFPLENRGWYVHGEGAETRSQSETRAAKFYTWLCEHLDEQLYGSTDTDDDVFDAGVALPEEEHECEHDLFTPKTRRRRTTLLIGHGDFMSLVLKRIVAGFGHAVETEGIPHRTYSHNVVYVTFFLSILLLILYMMHRFNTQVPPLFISTRPLQNWNTLVMVDF